MLGIAGRWSPGGSGSVTHYGLGWGVGSFDGHRFLAHSGAHMTGFTSSLVRYRDDALTVILLTNAGGADPTRMAQHIAGLYKPALMPAKPKAIEDKDPKVTFMLQDLSTKFRNGAVTADHFTPEMWKALSPQLEEIRHLAEGDCEVKKLELLSCSESNGDKTYRYRMICARRIYLITLDLNAQGKSTGLWDEVE